MSQNSFYPGMEYGRKKKVETKQATVYLVRHPEDTLLLEIPMNPRITIKKSNSKSKDNVSKIETYI